MSFIRIKSHLLVSAALMPISGGFALAQTPETDDVRIEDTIIVTGRAIVNYRAVDTLTGTKTNALVKDIPLTVSVVPAQLIEDRSITYLGEALDTVSGAQRKQGYGGVHNFGAFIRGVDASFLTLRNGVRDFGFYTLRDSANVERFEVLKGPGSVLYGAVTPGGITNTITKKTTSDPLARVSALIGSHDFFRGEVDLGGPILDDFSYRLNASVEDSGSFRDQVENKSYFIAPVVSWRLGNNTEWVIEAEHKNSEYTWDLGLPRHPSSFDLPIDRFLGEPDGVNDVSSTYLASVFEHHFNDAWRFRQTTGYTTTKGNYQIRSFFGAPDENQLLNRVAYETDEESTTFVLQNDLTGEFSTGGIDHQLVVGVEHYDVEQVYNFVFQPLAPINVVNPVYGAQPGSGFPLFADDVSTKANAIYVQDLISVGEKIKILVGGRYDTVDSETVNLLSGNVSHESSNDALTPQAGIVYQPDEATSLYVSYGESFVPITNGVTRDGTTLNPEEGQQVEFGVKRSWLDGRLFTTLAFYEIMKQNVSTPDPTDPTFRIQTGEQRSRGAEIDISGSPFTGLDLVFAASYIDAEITKDNRFAVGSALPGAPKYSASLWGKYTVQSGAVEGLALGAGLFYVDDRQAGLPNFDWTLPSYTRVDALISYPFDNFTFQLNIKNVTDEKIYDLTSTTILPQAPRSVLARVSYDF